MSFSKRRAGKRTERAVPALASSERADVVSMSPTRPSQGTTEPLSAIDPHILTVEIGLLFDYISGFPGRSLASGSRGRLPFGSDTYEQALTRYFAIDDLVRHREAIPPADVQFLLELRDYLNGQAEPATGATIAFSTLVIRRTAEGHGIKADAERAYPEWIPVADALRRAMVVLQILSVVITLTVAAVAAYAYVGNRVLANLADISARLKLLDTEISRREEKEPNTTEGGVLSYCDGITYVAPDPANPDVKVQRFRTPTQAHLCAQQSDLLKKNDLTYQGFARWIPPYDGELAAALDVLKGYVMPVLMGMLGSMAYVLRRYLRSIGERLLTPRDLREYVVRLVLGTVCGVAIGFFTSWRGQSPPEGGFLDPTVSLGAPALAFLAGYGVEVVFRMLDGLAEQMFAARK
jgi:hypothetical protein